MELLPADETGKWLCWPNLAAGEARFCWNANGSAANASETFVCWHFSCLFTFCLRLCIAEGTAAEPASIHQGLAHRQRHYERCVGCRHLHPPSHVCLRRPTRQQNTQPVTAKYQSVQADTQRGRSWSIHVMISRGGSNQAPMKHTDLREMFGSVKKGQREAEGPVRQEVHVRIQVLLVCWQSFTSSLTFHGEQRRAVMTDWCPPEGRTPLMAPLRFSVPAFRNVLMNWQQFVSS